MLQQTQSQKQNLSLEIEHLLKHDLSLTIQYYISKYKAVLQSRLGMNEDDILNDVRIQIWKGLISWSSNKPAGKKTFINNILKNRFATLYQQTTMDKYNKIDYYSDPFSATGANSRNFIDFNTGESILLRREAFLLDNEYLILDTYKSIYEDLKLGLTLKEMCKKHSMTVVQLTIIINEIHELLK